MEHRCGVDYPRCPGCQERIAELEAELADLREYKDWQETVMQGLPDAYRAMQARAEEAEAEVKRLRAENRAMWEALGRPLSVEEART